MNKSKRRIYEYLSRTSREALNDLHCNLNRVLLVRKTARILHTSDLELKADRRVDLLYQIKRLVDSELYNKFNNNNKRIAKL